MKIDDLHPLDFFPNWEAADLLIFGFILLCFAPCVVCVVCWFEPGRPAVSDRRDEQQAADGRAQDDGGVVVTATKPGLVWWLPLLILTVAATAVLYARNYSPQPAKDALAKDVVATYGVTLDQAGLDQFVSEVNHQPLGEPVDTTARTATGDELEVILMKYKGRAYVIDAATGIELPTTGDNR